jgi:hypothetical protein
MAEMNTADNQLKLLISLCEEEKSQLLGFIAECLAESEYLMAHHYSEALSQLNRRLQNLNRINDRWYPEKLRFKRKIEVAKLQIESGNDASKYYEEDLRYSEGELDKLNQIPVREMESITPVFFDGILPKLFERKIKNLKLVLKNAENLLLGFTYSGKMLKVTLPYVKQHIRTFTLHDENMGTFKNLGFTLTEDGSRLVLMLSGSGENIVNMLKVILSKVVFEIFYIWDFDNESFMQFTAKAK